jgi:hypothetical protein
MIDTSTDGNSAMQRISLVYIAVGAHTRKACTTARKPADMFFRLG